MTFRMIQPIGSMPKPAPYTADMPAMPTGMPKPTMAISKA